MKVFCILLTGSLLLVLTGCSSDKTKYLNEEINTLQQQNVSLSRQVENQEEENEKLKQQINVLSGLDEESKYQNIYSLETINLRKYTNFYDKNDDGKKEKFIVYIQPVDKDGDVIKAIGSVNVQLWDLDREQGQALLGKWHVGAEELSKNWFTSLLGTNYRLSFDIDKKLDQPGKSYTVKIKFVDSLSGKVFEDQRLFKVE